MTKYESQVYTLPITQASAFARLQNLRSFEGLKKAFENPAAMEQILAMAPKDQIKPEQIDQFREVVSQLQFSQDSVLVPSKMGMITLAIVERESPKLVKLAAQGAPVEANLWVQLLPKGVYECAIKVTVGAKLNFFIRKMVEKQLKQAPDGVGSMLAQMLPHLPELPLEVTPQSCDFEPIED